MFKKIIKFIIKASKYYSTIEIDKREKKKIRKSFYIMFNAKADYIDFSTKYTLLTSTNSKYGDYFQTLMSSNMKIIVHPLQDRTWISK